MESLETTERSPSNADSVLEIDLDGEVWFSAIRRLIKEKQIRSIDHLLRELPDTLKGRYLLSFDSLSLQKSTFQAPRAMLISPGANFVMTFNGDPALPGFEAIETMRFTRQKGLPRFIFEELSFEEDVTKRRDFLIKKGQAGAARELMVRADREGPNPPLCLSCHRSNPRPNWESYPFWPTFYGQFDDRPFALSGDSYAHPHSGEPVDAALLNRVPAMELKKFINRDLSSTRYGHLQNLRQTFAPAMSSQPEGRTAGEDLSRFTHDISILNFERIAGELASKQNIEVAARVLLSLWNCPVPGLEDSASRNGSSVGIKNLIPYLRGSISTEELENFSMNLYPVSWANTGVPLTADRQFSYFIIQRYPRLKGLFVIRRQNYPPFNEFWSATPRTTILDNDGYDRPSEIDLDLFCKSMNKFAK